MLKKFWIVYVNCIFEFIGITIRAHDALGCNLLIIFFCLGVLGKSL